MWTHDVITWFATVTCSMRLLCVLNMSQNTKLWLTSFYVFLFFFPQCLCHSRCSIVYLCILLVNSFLSKWMHILQACSSFLVLYYQPFTSCCFYASCDYFRFQYYFLFYVSCNYCCRCILHLLLFNHCVWLKQRLRRKIIELAN